MKLKKGGWVQYELELAPSYKKTIFLHLRGMQLFQLIICMYKGFLSCDFFPGKGCMGRTVSPRTERKEMVMITCFLP